MKRTVWLWSLCGFALTSLLGTLLHFLYEWCGESALVAPFSGVNESTWEHMKLLFWPMLLFALIEAPAFREYKSFWCVKMRGILTGLALIPVLFYAYNGIIGRSPDYVNIAIFFISAFVAYAYETRALVRDRASCTSERFSLAVILIVAALFVIFTFKTPHLAIFRDPITGSYGI
ncbi:MAG: hypothetical protein J6V09_07010 [Clostridia bacterium]|nr:hypothetical protein [Clostridia bacterium]